MNTNIIYRTVSSWAVSWTKAGIKSESNILPRFCFPSGGKISAASGIDRLRDSANNVVSVGFNGQHGRGGMICVKSEKAEGVDSRLNGCRAADGLR
jgi:hypothetical protein